MRNALMCLLLLGCGPDASDREPDGQGLTEQPHGSRGELPGDSIYQVEAELESHAGTTVGLDLYRGQPTLVSMFYASCPMACPMLIQDVQTLEAALPPEQRRDVRVLLVSLDPERDTPQLMREVVVRHDIDEERWTLARTSPEGVREIAAVLGVRYRMLADGEMNHSSIVTVLDREGRVVATQEGLRQDPGPLVRAVEEVWTGE